VAEYLYRHVAGIEAAAPAFRAITIQPAVGEGLTWARASYDSISGRITSSWRRDGSRLALEVDIPPNATATVYVPAASADVAAPDGAQFVRFEQHAAAFHVGSGHYAFRS